MNQNSPESKPREQVDWKRVKVFRDDPTTFAVVVSMLPLKRPKYSIAMGRIINPGMVDKDGLMTDKLFPHFYINRQRDAISQVVLECDYETIIAKMVMQALQWIEGQMSLDLQYELDEKRLREERDANRGKPVTRTTGKTERERAKHKQS